MNTTHAQLYASYLDMHIKYNEFKRILDYMRDMLSWEKITGVKQMSIFDDYKISDDE